LAKNFQKKNSLPSATHRDTRQRILEKKNSLPSATPGTLGKEFSKKILCRVPHTASAPLTLFAPSRQLFFAECCRGTTRQKTLGKEVFADEIFEVYTLPLPSAALGKAFAECI
jgi:hypothetical protein